MALHRRAFLASLGVAAAGCASDDAPEPTDSATQSGTPSATASPTGTEPAYARCDPEIAPTEALHTAGGIPEPLGEPEASSYARELEQDILLPPRNERSDGYVSIGTIEVDTVEHGYLVTVPVTGGYYNKASDDGSTVTVHADLGTHTATYFINEEVVLRAEETNAEPDPRNHGEVVVCESD